MTVTIRRAERSDIDGMADLIVADARQRHARDPVLFALDDTAPDKTRAALVAAMSAEAPPFRQAWLLAVAGRATVGIAHSILLPVPPIYAGAFGPPGLLMEDCCVAEAAPAGTRAALIEAAEADLRSAGAKVLLASSVTGGDWAAAYAARSYAPLTLYLSRAGLRAGDVVDGVRGAGDGDISAIVTASAANRELLAELDPFWDPHPEADARFRNWMARSLTLADRDMFVAQEDGALSGYAISQPATPLHFPVPHDISRTGIIDDFYHTEFARADKLAANGRQAAALLGAAEAARQARGDRAVLVVCPAAWTSRLNLLEADGYRTAMAWFIKR